MPRAVAAAFGRTDIARILLDEGADVSARNPVTPLGLAARHGHEETAALLREHGGVE